MQKPFFRNNDLVVVFTVGRVVHFFFLYIGTLLKVLDLAWSVKLHACHQKEIKKNRGDYDHKKNLRYEAGLV